MKGINSISNEKGLSLVELLVTLLITSILMGTVISVFLMAQKLYFHGEGTSYKQKSITNVETELQNSLAKAMIIKISQTPSGDYSIGFNNSGKCVIGNGEYGTDQIKDINLVINGNTMTYKLIPKNSAMSTLSSGIVLNNFKNSNFIYEEFENGNLNRDLPRYLSVIFATP